VKKTYVASNIEQYDDYWKIFEAVRVRKNIKEVKLEV